MRKGILRKGARGARVILQRGVIKKVPTHKMVNLERSKMKGGRRIFFLILILSIVGLTIGGTSITLLYQTAFRETEARLTETAQSQARLLEAVARFDAVNRQDYPGGAIEATLSQIRDAHERYIGFGETGEFTLAKQESDHMVFLLSHRHYDRDLPQPVPFDSELAEPMRRSLSGQSGTLVGLDYRGEMVLAAYEPVAILDLGIVAKIDLIEIRAPFVKTGIIAMFSGLLIVIIGAVLIIRTTNPLLRELEGRERRFRRLFEQSNDAVFIHDLQGQILDVNDRACEMLNYARDQLLPLRIFDLHPEQAFHASAAAMQTAKKEGVVRFESQFKKIDGSLIEVDISSKVVDPEEKIVQGIVRDITERKKTEDQSKTNLAIQQVRNEVLQMRVEEDWSSVARCIQRELKNLMEFDSLGINIITRDRGTFYSYEIASEGALKGETVDSLPLSLKHAMDKEEVVYRRNRAEMMLFNDKIGAERNSAVDVPFIEGTIAVNSVKEEAFSEEDIQILKQFSLVISEAYQRLADLRLWEQERLLMQTLLSYIPDVIYFKDKEAKFIRISQSLADLFSAVPEDIVGKTDLDFFEKDLARLKYEDDLEILKTGKSIIDKEEVDITKSGKKRWVSTTKIPRRDSEGNIVGLFGISRDITGRKQMEGELIRLERLRAVGELAAGISHNLNNVLTTVLGPAHLILRHSDDPRVRREAEDIMVAGRRARDLVHRLNLSVQGATDDQLQAVHVNEIVEAGVQATRPRWKDQPQARGVAIEVVTELEDLPPVWGTETELYDALLNLIFNAVDAMSAGGTITIRTQQMGEVVQLTVRDTGIGMDEKTRQRVFEPFFTTKRDVGSGLGLSTAYGTITSWGGKIEVESAPGEGTCFTLRLPVSWEAVAPTEERAEARRSRPGKVLVVEDEEKVCQLLARLLAEEHEVVTVPDGREALERFVPGQYDVALIDLGMGRAPGDLVAREMRQADPALVTVLITGWELRKDDLRLAPFAFWLQKPFDDLDRVKNIVTQAIALHDTRIQRKV